MTRERIEDIGEILLPFVRNVLLKTNYENMGKSDAEEFTRDFNEILDLAIKALEQEPIIDKITEIIEPLRHLSIDEMSDIEWQILRVIDKYKADREALADCYKPKLKSDLCIMDEFAFEPKADRSEE